MRNKEISIEEIVYEDCCIDCPRARRCHEEADTCDSYEERLEELMEEMKEKKVKKFYIEFVDVASDDYIIQTKWFDTEEEAIGFIKENFDFIDRGTYGVDLMSAIFPEGDETYEDIKFERRLNGEI